MPLFTRLLVFIGIGCVLAGLLELFGVYDFKHGGGVGLIVVGLLLVGFAEFVLGGGFAGRPVRGTARGRL